MTCHFAKLVLIETYIASLLIELSIGSMTEIQNARGLMDVLAEMLSAIDPSNKEVSCFISAFKIW